jgi:hypothetical protein
MSTAFKLWSITDILLGRLSKCGAADLIIAQWAAIFQRQPFNAFQGDLRISGNPDLITFGPKDLCNSIECQRRRDADDSEANGTSPYRYDGIVLLRFGGHVAKCGRTGVSVPFGT